MFAHARTPREKDGEERENTTILILLKEGKSQKIDVVLFLVEICGMLIGEQELG